MMFSVSIRSVRTRLFALISTAALFSTGYGLQAEPSTDEVIAKAREYLGGDEALNAVQSLYYRGTFETADGVEGEVEIMFQKPLFQRVKTIRDDITEVTALSYYDGWRKITQRDDEANWTIVFLDAGQIRELQANTWENLNFFQGIERRRGRIVNDGLVEVDGHSCVKLTFGHPGGIYFVRYFDAETGQLRLTEASGGGQIREEGIQEVAGIRFPETIIMMQDGEELNRIHFTEIEVNREFDSELFDVPSMAPSGSNGGLPRVEDPDDPLLDLPSPVEP
jgi:hypothetical protein